MADASSLLTSLPKELRLEIWTLALQRDHPVYISYLIDREHECVTNLRLVSRLVNQDIQSSAHLLLLRRNEFDFNYFHNDCALQDLPCNVAAGIRRINALIAFVSDDRLSIVTEHIPLLSSLPNLKEVTLDIVGFLLPDSKCLSTDPQTKHFRDWHADYRDEYYDVQLAPVLAALSAWQTPGPQVIINVSILAEHTPRMSVGFVSGLRPEYFDVKIRYRCDQQGRRHKMELSETSVKRRDTLSGPTKDTEVIRSVQTAPQLPAS